MFFLEEADHGDWSINSRLHECSWGPGHANVVMASPCHALNPVLMRWVENHGMFCPIWTGMAFMPICECVLPVFLSEFRQNVHGIDTKVDHDGIGIGSGEPTEVSKHLGHLPSLGGPRGILPSFMTHRGILILRLLESHLDIISPPPPPLPPGGPQPSPLPPGRAPLSGMSPPPCISLLTSSRHTTGGTGG